MILLVYAALLSQASGLGNWTVSSHRDPITDKDEVSAVLNSPEGELSFFCSRGERSILAVRPRAFLGGPVSRYELRDTWVRFDSAPAQMDSWKYVSDYATPYSDSNVRTIIGRMRSASRMTLRLSAYDRSFVDITFDLAGAEAAISQAIARC